MQTAVDAWPTRKLELILQIVDGVYAAACSEATWEQALAKICRLGSLDGAALSMVGAAEARQSLLAYFGLGSRTNSGALHGTMAGESRLVNSILRSPPGTVLRGHEIMADPTTISSGWTRSVPVKEPIAWACVIVGREERRVVCLEVHARGQRAPGCPDPDDLMRQLAPHLVRAWRFGRASGAALAADVHTASSPCFQSIVSAADRAGLPETARLRAEFGLTKAEARLALRLAAGSSLASAAQAFDVKLTTIRSQLQQVFAKTGASRQTELVAMLLSRGYVRRALNWSPDRTMQAAVAFAS
jgi:DNA-binding CsgD family transcriptional regulator